MEKITIFYQTAIDIPPPHSFSVKAELQNSSKNELLVKIEQIFTDRGEIPKLEIEAEGFSEEDDFVWEGKLPSVWLEQFEKLLSVTSFQDEGGPRIGLQIGNDQSIKGPNEVRSWILLIEEFIQACLEESGKEQAMEVVLGRLEKNNFYDQARVTWNFPERKAFAETINGESKSFADSEWSGSQREMQDWIEEEASTQDMYQIPKNKGWFWLLNGEIWLPFQKSQTGEVWNWIVERVKF